MPFPTLPEYPTPPNYASGFNEAEYLDKMRRVEDERRRLIEQYRGSLVEAQTQAIADNTAANLQAASQFSQVLQQLGEIAGAPEPGSGMPISEVFDRIKDAEDRIKAAMLAAIREAEPGVAPT